MVMSGAVMVCAGTVFRTEAKAKAAIVAKSGFRWKRDTGYLTWRESYRLGGLPEGWDRLF